MIIYSFILYIIDHIRIANMPEIEISKETFGRLESKAVGFDTPELVIKRLLDEAEGKPESKPIIVFEPADETEFKRLLLNTREAEIALYKTDDSREMICWNASRFNEGSNLRANLWSGYLRGWKDKSIVRAELAILPEGTADPGDTTFQNKRLATVLGLKFEELEENEGMFEILPNESADGLPYSYRVQFSDEFPKPILKRIVGLNPGNWVEVDQWIFDRR